MWGSAFFYRRTPRFVHALRRISGANYELEMELLDAVADKAKVAVDVGAKVGMYTYRLRDRFRSVLAFDPIPMHHEMLRAVFGGRGGQIEGVALSDAPSQVTLRMPFGPGGERQWGRSTIERANPLAHRQVARVEELVVEARTLDSYELPDVGFIKIDVEGHELAVLAGAAATIARCQPCLLVECNDDHRPGGRAALVVWLEAAGYEALFLADRRLAPIAEYSRAEHWDRHDIENIVGVPRGATELRARLASAASRLRRK